MNVKVIFILLCIIIITECASDASKSTGKTIELEEAHFFIEYNDTDKDAGVQVFLDGEKWEWIDIYGPYGDKLYSIITESNVTQIGITELLFESGEAELDEFAFQEFLNLYPPGGYNFRGRTVDGDKIEGVAIFTHDIPDPPIVSPVDGSVIDPKHAVISWQPVTKPDGIQILGYEVIIEREDPNRELDIINLPSSATQVTIPAGFLENDTEYEFEVIVKEVSGNQTITESSFRTSSNAVHNEEIKEDEGKLELEEAQFFIEYNDTDQDAGVQAFFDGEEWEWFDIYNPSGEKIYHFEAFTNAKVIGITEMFFESSEPSFRDMPFNELLALYPEGIYKFVGKTIDGEDVVGETEFTHKIPVAAVVSTNGAVTDPKNTIISWQPVTEPAGIEIFGYEVIIETEDEDPLRICDFKNLPSSATEITIPVEFLEYDMKYKFEVLVKEISGNQIITETTFRTMKE